ncbi:MAG TPA: hypothetical protein VLJ80_07340 [Solirubrobacteraceae bacterium]|nr:hypothetical protein [Solirubrobacteraceae bacterium]
MRWLTGPVPPKGATPLERLRFLRGVTVRPIVFFGPIFAVVLVFGTFEWLTLAICAFFLFGSANVLAITLKVRRTEKAERERR